MVELLATVAPTLEAVKKMKRKETGMHHVIGVFSVCIVSYSIHNYHYNPDLPASKFKSQEFIPQDMLLFGVPWHTLLEPHGTSPCPPVRTSVLEEELDESLGSPGWTWFG